MSSRLLYQVFTSKGLLSLLMGLLLLGLLILLNTFFLMFFASRFGAYVTLAGAGLISLASTAIIWSSIRRYTGRIRTLAKTGIVPHLAYINTSGLVFSIILSVIPGPLCSLLAWIFYIPPLRLGLGAFLYKVLQEEFTALHEDIQAE